MLSQAKLDRDDVVERLQGLMTELAEAQHARDEATEPEEVSSSEAALHDIEQELHEARRQGTAAEEQFEYAMSLRGQVVSLDQMEDLPLRTIVEHHATLLHELQVDLGCCPRAQSLVDELAPTAAIDVPDQRKLVGASVRPPPL